MKIKMRKENKGKMGEGRWVLIILSLIVFLGLVLRLIGIKHGFPFIFHPDEPTIVRSALGIRFDSNPKHFDWPHLYIYLNYFLYMGFAKIRDILVSVGFKDTVSNLFPLLWNEDLIYYLLTRCFSAILGALTAIPVFLAGKEMFGKRAGLLGALAITLMPYHVWHSHYSLGDVPMVFFLAWALYFSSLLIKRSDLKLYLLSGLFIGLSASVKYNGGLSALMVPIAHFLRSFWLKKNARENGYDANVLNPKGILSLILSGVSALFGFLIGTPFALLDFDTFSRNDGPQGAFWQFKNVGSVSFSEHIGKFFTESFGKLLFDTGYAVIPVFFIGLGLVLYKVLRRKVKEEDISLIFLYSVSLFLIWYLSGFKNSRSHYYFIVYPYLAIIFGYFTAFVQSSLRRVFSGKPFNLSSGKQAVLFPFLFMALFFVPLFFKSAINSYRYFNGDTRNLLHEWLVKNYSPFEGVYYNDKILVTIFKDLDIKAFRGFDRFDTSDDSLVIIYEPGIDDNGFVEKNSTNLEEVVRFDSDLRLGSDIEVYRYYAPDRDCGCGN